MLGEGEGEKPPSAAAAWPTSPDVKEKKVRLRKKKRVKKNLSSRVEDLEALLGVRKEEVAELERKLQAVRAEQAELRLELSQPESSAAATGPAAPPPAAPPHS
eukprot:Hpha_TRINITY_DN5793_c0_g1::TRINITY_DN5793_c0_g1_i1::g.147577::m.147577